MPSPGERRSFANTEEATCHGAYAVAMAAALTHLGLKTIGRSETKTGSDWYLVPNGAQPAEDGEWHYDRLDISRLEVSGIDRDDDSRMRKRLGEKVAQARRGHSSRPAYAAVVGFAGPHVCFAKVLG
jgi:hypothetical protein